MKAWSTAFVVVAAALITVAGADGCSEAMRKPRLGAVVDGGRAVDAVAGPGGTTVATAPGATEEGGHDSGAGAGDRAIVDAARPNASVAPDTAADRPVPDAPLEARAPDGPADVAGQAEVAG